MTEILSKFIKPVVKLIPLNDKLKESLKPIISGLKIADQLIGTFSPNFRGRMVLNACTVAWEDKIES